MKNFNRREFLETSAGALGSLLFPGSLFAFPSRISCDPVKVDEWINCLSLSRKVLLYDDISQIGCALRYEQGKGSCYWHDGYVIRSNGDEVNVAINDISCDTEPKNKFSAEYNTARRLADIEDHQLLRLLFSGAGTKLRNNCTLTPAIFNTAFRHIEQHDLYVQTVIISTEDFETIKNWGKDFVSVPYSPEWSPKKAVLWTADVYITELLESGTAIVLAAPDTTGVYCLKRACYKKGDRMHVHAGQALINDFSCVMISC